MLQLPKLGHREANYSARLSINVQDSGSANHILKGLREYQRPSRSSKIRNTVPGKIFVAVISLLIICSAVFFAIKTLADLSDSTMHLLGITKIVIIGIGMIAVPSGLAASALSKVREKK